MLFPDYAQGLFHYGVVVVADLVISFRTPDLPGHHGFDPVLQDYFVFWRHGMKVDGIFGGIGGERAPELVFTLEMCEEVGRVFIRLEGGQVLNIISIDKPAEGSVYIEGGNIPGQGAGVKTDKDIRGDASPAEYGSFLGAEGSEGGAGMAGGCLAEE